MFFRRKAATFEGAQPALGQCPISSRGAAPPRSQRAPLWRRPLSNRKIVWRARSRLPEWARPTKGSKLPQQQSNRKLTRKTCCANLPKAVLWIALPADWTCGYRKLLLQLRQQQDDPESNQEERLRPCGTHCVKSDGKADGRHEQADSGKGQRQTSRQRERSIAMFGRRSSNHYGMSGRPAGRERR